MWTRLAPFAIALTLLGAVPSRAAELDDFNAGVEAFSSHHRVTLGYLRTGNLELAAVELERMDEAWRSVVARFGGDPPAVVTDRVLYTTTLTDIATRIVGARIVLNIGRADVAGQTLQEARGALARLRRASGIVVLADCVLDANQAMDALLALRASDLAAAEGAAEVRATATRYTDALERCDALAAAAVRHDPEFRRLVDGALASLTMVGDAVARRDSDGLGRLLDELRAFDRLLAFRFG